MKMQMLTRSVSFHSHDRGTIHLLLLQSCPDGIRTKMALSSFAKRFLGRIPVLQWAKHATLAEYQRLRQYPGAHGWGGLEFPCRSHPSVFASPFSIIILCDFVSTVKASSACQNHAVISVGEGFSYQFYCLFCICIVINFECHSNSFKHGMNGCNPLQIFVDRSHC